MTSIDRSNTIHSCIGGWWIKWIPVSGCVCARHHTECPPNDTTCRTKTNFWDRACVRQTERQNEREKTSAVVSVDTNLFSLLSKFETFNFSITHVYTVQLLLTSLAVVVAAFIVRFRKCRKIRIVLGFAKRRVRISIFLCFPFAPLSPYYEFIWFYFREPGAPKNRKPEKKTK